MVLESLTPTVVFRYNNDAVEDNVYMDNLNSWVSRRARPDWVKGRWGGVSGDPW